MSIDGKPICKLKFAEDIDLKGGSNGEFQETRRQSNGIWNEVSTEKSKFMTNSTYSMSADISMNGKRLEGVISFKYLGVTLCKDGTCSSEIRIRIATAMAAAARLNRIRRSNTISCAGKFKLYKSLITAIPRDGCET